MVVTNISSPKILNPFTTVRHPGGFRGGFRVTLLGFIQQQCHISNESCDPQDINIC